ncbi:hypothetical protein [Neobacillus dielmonensis]|uniref:hypothetical protein n=1 Tax=Neobacillus dielmonensis TaxID=1347369 RepID=UPI0005A8B9FA|nr:hypothetical protein [Neobacillus dielmonensis]
MEAMQHDVNTPYEELQAEINKKIYEFTNCRAFTIAFGRAMEQHLIQLGIYKKLTTKWLNCLDIPTKDELAAISNRMVRMVEQIDSLDDVMYSTNTQHNQAMNQLKLVRHSFEELRSVLKTEIQELKQNNIPSLEADLKNLKRLFQIDYKGE